MVEPPPESRTLCHVALIAGAIDIPIVNIADAQANPAMKLLRFGFKDGRYRKPEPAEWGGMMKMSYLPGGSPDDFGTSP